MPPRVEKSPAKRERFTYEERWVLLDELLAHGKWLRSNLVFNSPHLDPYAELLAITTILMASGGDLAPQEKNYLRKMAALEARRLTPPTKTAGDARFWETAQVLVGSAWEKAQSFAEDLSDVPKSWIWQRTRDDLFLFSSELRKERPE